MNSLRANAGLLKKLPVPHAVFPVATIAAGVVNLLLALLPLLGLLVVTGHPLTPALLFLPVSIAIATLFTLGAGLLLAPLAVFFYDVVEVIGVLMTLALYLTPIIYPLSILPPRFLAVIRYSPLRSILEIFRDPIYYGKDPATVAPERRDRRRPRHVRHRLPQLPPRRAPHPLLRLSPVP
jgi:ABC-type polysaccharide/polyol phosphate export permease